MMKISKCHKYKFATNFDDKHRIPFFTILIFNKPVKISSSLYGTLVKKKQTKSIFLTCLNSENEVYSYTYCFGKLVHT